MNGLRRLTQKELSTIRELITRDDSETLLRTLHQLVLRWPIESPESVPILEEAGLCVGDELTEVGALVADSAREYTFWEERDRALPSEEQVPMLRRETYRDKEVVEIGCGAGCNLFSLNGLPTRLVGIEPMPVYAQMSRILAERAGLPAPHVLEGSAEELPFVDGSFDIVLCYTSHQYMNINRALQEAARVLRPGGQLKLIGATLPRFTREAAGAFLANRSLGTLKYDTFAIGNTIFDELIGRRILGVDKTKTTATPIYPSRASMKRRFAKAGFFLSQHDTKTVTTGETAFIAVKR